MAAHGSSTTTTTERLPVFLLAAYGKNGKANLSMAERNAIKRLIPVLVAGYLANDKRTR